MSSGRGKTIHININEVEQYINDNWMHREQRNLSPQKQAYFLNRREIDYAVPSQPGVIYMLFHSW